MNRFISLLIAVALYACLAGCGSESTEIDYADSYVDGQDSQENLIKFQSQDYMAESDESYYYLNNDTGFLYVIDKSSHECMPLCNKSDCLHDKETSYENKQSCIAYVNASGESLVYYDGRLYYQYQEDKKDKDGVTYTLYEIVSISPDGSDRNIVYSTRDYYIWDFKIHRGYIYFDGSKVDSEGTASGKNTALMRVSLDGDADESELLPYYKYGIQENLLLTDSRFYGNHIFLLFYYTDPNDANATEQKILVNYNLQTDEWVNLSDKLDVNLDSMFTVFNNKLVFANGNKIYECDFDGENEKQVLDCGQVLDGYDYYTPLSNDGTHLFISCGTEEDGDGAKLIFCDKDYETEVKTMPFAFSAFMGCDSDSFVYYNESDSSIYYFDKQSMGSLVQYNESDGSIYYSDKQNAQGGEKIYTFQS